MSIFPFQRHRITHHRGPVTGILVAGACDVLISGSHDKNICVWDLDNFALLNTMHMTSPVLRIDISWNSVSLTTINGQRRILLSLNPTSAALANSPHKLTPQTLCGFFKFNETNFWQRQKLSP